MPLWLLSASVQMVVASTPISLDGVANSSRLDATARDGKGGWVDLGSNDLHVLPSGKQDFAGVDFVVPVAKSEDEKNCIVLGLDKDSGDDVEITVDGKSAQGKHLYLLHACHGGYRNHDRIGKVEFVYEDGSTEKKNVRFGRDVADWMHPHGGKNAVRAWSEYNHNTQVSLFVSQFEINGKKRLSKIEFDVDGGRVWMIVAASFDSPKSKLRGLVSELSLTGKYQSPPVPEKPFPMAAKGAKPKNVILIIGDGMGQGAVTMQSLYQYGKPESSYFCRFPVSTLCTTYSASSEVTDSAASGTAIATGSKTSNGVLGLRIAGDMKTPEHLVSFAELAHAQGKKVALVTQDALTGATPGAFYAHVRGRGEFEKIASQASKCGFDVLLGHRGSMRFFLPEKAQGVRKDGVDVLAGMCKNGYVLAKSQAEFDAASKDKKVVGFWDVFDGERALGEMVRTSLERIGDAEKGFFMMAECYLTDNGGHSNLPEISVRGVTQVEWMAKVAMDYAQKRNDTLVIVTSDHETGGIIVSRSGNGNGDMHIFYGDTSHTKAPVPLYAYGPGAERLDRMLDNAELSKIIAELMDVR